jgi:hypothetical protein
MPCYRCGARQADPEAGKPSPWKRGVLAEHQVLICPDCLPSAIPELDRCAACGGVRLIRRLDQVECRDCRHVRDAGPEPPAVPGTATAPDAAAAPGAGAVPGAGAADRAPGAGAADAGAPGSGEPGGGAPVVPGLADEVARALDRLLGRG